MPWAIELKVRLPGEKASDGVGATPMPESGMDCGLPGALSKIFRVADSATVVVGENVMLKEQLAFGASAALHVVDCEKSPAFVPEMEVAPRLSVND